ncbi:MAG: hypothetical protein AAB353_01420 [Candidatus Hydrogenedentota bacterium]
MAQILIRDLDVTLVKRLKERAQENGRSLQAEVKEIIERAARVNEVSANVLVARIRRETRGKEWTDSVELLREDRYS